MACLVDSVKTSVMIPACLLAGLWLAAPHAVAGRPCQPTAQSVRSITQGLALAERTVARLDASGVRVAVLARAGQDLSAYGQRYSHLGLAYKKGEVWRVVHKLNECGSDRSALYRQGIGDFFLDAPFEYVAAIVPLAPEVQARLLPALLDGRTIAHLHTPAYSMLAYPWSFSYQQSNQWAIETLASNMDAGGSAGGRAAAQAWLRAHGYLPGEVHLGTLTRLGARITAANISFDDHPLGLRMTGRIRTVTADSVLSWLQRSGLGGTPLVVY